MTARGSPTNPGTSPNHSGTSLFHSGTSPHPDGTSPLALKSSAHATQPLSHFQSGTAFENFPPLLNFNRFTSIDR